MNVRDFQRNLQEYLDQVIETGQSLEIECKGHRLKIILEDEPLSKFDRLIDRKHIIKSDDLIHTPWKWHNDLP